MFDFVSAYVNDPANIGTLATGFWAVLGTVCCVAVWRYKGGMAFAAPKIQPYSTPVITEAQSNAELAAPVPSEAQETTEVKPRMSLHERMRNGRRTLPVIEYVDFDWTNKEHCKALDMLMHEPAQLHPTLRFHFDPSIVDNAYMAMLMTVAHQHINRINAPKKVKTTAAKATTKKASVPTRTDGPLAVIPLRKQQTS